VKQFFAFFISYVIALNTQAQVTIIGHTFINNIPLKEVTIQVMQDEKLIQTFSTKNDNYFKLSLLFGKNYRIYFSQTNCVKQFMEVNTKTVPEDKRNTLMTYEVDLPFVYKNDSDIDTTVFKNTFHKVIFDGNRRMVDDSSYNNAFLKSIIKKEKVITPTESNTLSDIPTQLVGTLNYNGKNGIAMVNKEVQLLNDKGDVLKTTHTNHYGQFVFSNVVLKNVQTLRLNIDTKEINTTQKVTLTTSNAEILGEESLNKTSILFASIKNLKNDAFTYAIGGKLIQSDPRQKQFFANKPVYLSNKRNTIIKKTITNSFGAFVFENIKIDNDYFIGVDAFELKVNERIDLLNKDDQLIKPLDTLTSKRNSIKLTANDNKTFNDITLSENDMKMNVNAKVYGDNINNPLGKLKIILLNDQYEAIDSVLTDNFGVFKFKYLPFLKRFFLSAENTNQTLDNSNEDNLIKVITTVKGKKTVIKPLQTELNQLKEVYVDDPWLDVMNNKSTNIPLIENLQFDFGQSILLPSAMQTLDKVALALASNTSIKLELQAHTDSKGSEADNLALSEARAKAALNYLISKGISANRLSSKGFGEKQLVNACKDGVNCSEEQHAQNRRIEFKVSK
jgi:outer membrane protein OmpA-like peptidoglycan-associated protein